MVIDEVFKVCFGFGEGDVVGGKVEGVPRRGMLVPFFARLSASSLPVKPVCAFTQFRLITVSWDSFCSVCLHLRTVLDCSVLLVRARR